MYAFCTIFVWFDYYCCCLTTSPGRRGMFLLIVLFFIYRGTYCTREGGSRITKNVTTESKYHACLLSAKQPSGRGYLYTTDYTCRRSECAPTDSRVAAPSTFVSSLATSTPPARFSVPNDVLSWQPKHGALQSACNRSDVLFILVYRPSTDNVRRTKKLYITLFPTASLPSQRYLDVRDRTARSSQHR